MSKAGSAAGRTSAFSVPRAQQSQSSSTRLYLHREQHSEHKAPGKPHIRQPARHLDTFLLSLFDVHVHSNYSEWNPSALYPALGRVAVCPTTSRPSSFKTRGLKSASASQNSFTLNLNADNLKLPLLKHVRTKSP